VWRGDGCDAKVLPGFRELRIDSHRDVTPHVRRLTFRGDDLRPYDSDSMHVSLLFPPEGIAEPEWPRPAADGRTVWPPDDRRPAARIYTVRALDVVRGTMDIDFVRHAGTGIASGFAERAAGNALIGCTGPIGRKIPDADFYLLVGDETAIPAIDRILEKLPASTKGVALIEADNADERQFLACKADIDIRWLHRDGAEAGTTTLLEDAARSVTLPRDRKIFAWAGVESATARALRSHWHAFCALVFARSKFRRALTHYKSKSALVH
jgi:NADPH-dependent ferric siderophore reductase